MKVTILNWRASFVAVVLATFLIPYAGASGYSNPQLLVEPAWLLNHLKDKDLRILEVSTDESYRQGHIPTAVFLSIMNIMVPSALGSYGLPSPDMLEKLLSTMGIKKDAHVVIYDDAGGLYAARLFLTLDVFGHERISILNGGKEAWRQAAYPLTEDVLRIDPTEYKAAVNADLTVTAEWILNHVRDSSIAFVDSRSADEYRGQDIWAKRGGHIPGARNLEWIQNLQPNGTLKSAGELRRLYDQLGVSPNKTVVTYCQNHIRASVTYFVLRLLGYNRVKAYVPSWAEWGNREDLPVEK